MYRFLQFGRIGHIGQVFNGKITRCKIYSSAYHSWLVCNNALSTARARGAHHAQYWKRVFYGRNAIPQVLDCFDRFRYRLCVVNRDNSPAVVQLYLVCFYAFQSCQSLFNDECTMFAFYIFQGKINDLLLFICCHFFLL
ncbi:hypothetical protein D3C85_611120 [compost metagenome]